MKAIKIPMEILLALSTVIQHSACSSGAQTFYEALPAAGVSVCMVAPDVIGSAITDGGERS